VSKGTWRERAERAWAALEAVPQSRLVFLGGVALGVVCWYAAYSQGREAGRRECRS
jgi:hypothetical protein